jgi:hypothetical protein
MVEESLMLQLIDIHMSSLQMMAMMQMWGLLASAQQMYVQQVVIQLKQVQQRWMQ